MEAVEASVSPVHPTEKNAEEIVGSTAVEASHRTKEVALVEEDGTTPASLKVSQMRAIMGRLEGKSNAQVAKELGLSKHTVNDYWRHPLMKREYVAQKMRLLQAKRNAVVRGDSIKPVDEIVQANASMAAQVLVQTLNSSETKDETRIRSAERLLDMAGCGRKSNADGGIQVTLSDEAVKALCRCAEECERIRCKRAG